MLILKNNPHGGDVYSNKVEVDFSANVSPLGTPIEVKQSIINTVNSLTQYPDPHCTNLRESISLKYGVKNENILCGNGAADLIFSFCFALKPKKALIVMPTFVEYENALKAVDCSVDYYILKQEDNFELTEDFLNSINESYDTVFICNPNNPTGCLYKRELMQKVAQKCIQNNVILFIDECFIDLTDNHLDFTLTKDIATNNNLFILKAFTKSYGMAGVRLGFGFCSNQSLNIKICNVSQAWNISTIAQNAGIVALSCDEFLETTKELIKKEREFLKQSLLELGFKVFEPKANYIMLQYENGLYEKLMVKKIMIRRCENFTGLNNTYYRIAVKTHQDNVKLITALKEIVKGEK